MKRSIKLLALLVSASFCLQALAETITVTNNDDSGPGSLRQALADATNGDAINFSVSGTIRLTSDELAVNANIVIDGPGADMLAVNGNDDSRVFYISLGKTVTISGLTITQGKADLGGDFFFGGGIYNDHSTLTVSNCTLNHNSAQSGGGGIYNDHSTLTVSNCALSGNSAGDGGGIFNDGRSGGRATLSIRNSTFDGNWSRTRGGGILNTGSGGRATLSIINSTLNGNRASSEGGGIYNAGENDGTAMLTVSNSTLSGNRAQSAGGGIYNTGNTGRATLSTINNSTLSGNSSGFVGGGGILNDHATLTVSNSTLSGNSGGWRNGNVILNKQATLEIGDTILKAETSNTNILNDRGRITSFGYNLSSDNGGGVLTGPGDQINTDPMLGPLQDNGGPTLTHAPLIGSPAINTGDPNFTPPPDFDERGAGYPRVVNGRLDIGAIEVQAPPPRPTPTPRPQPTRSP